MIGSSYFWRRNACAAGREGSPPRSRPPRWLRLSAGGMTALFVWMVLLATPAQVWAHPAPEHQEGVRLLAPAEMTRMVGAQTIGGGGGGPVTHPTSFAAAAGGTYPWEGNVGDVNTGNGNKLTSLPLVGWTQRGGLPVAFTLFHNSQGNHNGEVGQKWTHSYDLYLVTGGVGSGGSLAPPGSMSVHWGNDLAYTFTYSGSAFAPPTGIYDSLVQNVDGSYTLTTKAQVKYHFNTGLYCDTITDSNGNQTSLSHNTGGYVTSVADATGRTLAFSYDTSNRISTVTDPLSRTWTLSYDTSSNLSQVALPLLAGQSVGSNYHYTLGYNTAHDLTSLTSPGGRGWTATYNAVDDSLASETDGCSNTTTYTYTASSTTITDANSHVVTHNYASGTLSNETDNLSHAVAYTYDTSYNKTAVQDQRGKTWNYTFDSRGNVLTKTDPLSNVTTYTYNSHNKVLTVTLPTSEQTVNTYNSTDNLTGVAHKNSSGVTQASESYTIDGNGLTTDAYDANSHHTQYGFDTDGNLTSVTTPNSRVTDFGYNGLGVKTGRMDALSQTTSYTLDTWNRVTTVTYPSGTNPTFSYDADNNLTQFTDATGTTTRVYDNDSRLTSESKGGSTIVSHTYDATGQQGLLSTTTDANGRTLTYSYTSRNQLYSVSETAGTTYYAYDNAGHETSLSNPNGTSVTKTYDDAGMLTSVVNQNSSSTTLSSFSYVYDTDNRRHTCTEASGDVVTYGYDWGSRLTSESRTGTNAYSVSYTLDGVGNRTSQSVTIGGTTKTTAFTLNSDDELTSTSSSTGGFVNSYGYNANGEQTSRTLSGTAYTLAYDYEGQITSITQGSNVVSFAYDAAGRRTSRTAGGTTTNFLYDGGQVLLEKQGSTTTATYTYGNALVRKDGETPLFDGLGSERTVTNSSQTITGTLTMDGFGNYVASSGSSNNPYMFAATSGYRNDGDAGLSHVGARYYDAQVGRFISRDTFLDQKPYLYCEHDPVNHLDPTGHIYGGVHLGGTAMFGLGGITVDIHINIGEGGISAGVSGGFGFGIGFGGTVGVGIGGGSDKVPSGPSTGIGYIGFIPVASGEVDSPGNGEDPTSGYGGAGRVGVGVGGGFMWAIECAYDQKIVNW